MATKKNDKPATTAPVATPVATPEGTPATNGDAGSKLNSLHAQWVKNGSVKLSKADGGAMITDYLKVKQARAQAEEAFEAARKAESDAVAAMVVKRGKGRIIIAGEPYVPMARGETVFLRREGGGETDDYGV